jgi:hypothetical protein
MLLRPAPRKFTTFNTFTTFAMFATFAKFAKFANFNPAVESSTLIPRHAPRFRSLLERRLDFTSPSPSALGRVPAQRVAVGG